MKKLKKRSPIKEKPLRVPGQSIEYEIEDVIVSIGSYIFVISMVLFLFFNQLVFKIHWTNVYFQVFFQLLYVFICAYCVIKIVLLRKKLLSLRLGQEGERAVGEQLLVLIRDGAVVLHDVVGEKFNIDHVVISKKGIFVIETKTFSKPVKGDASVKVMDDSIYVDGHKISRDPIKQVMNLSKWLQELLVKSTGRKFPIRPVVLFPGWFVEPMKSGADIWVLNPKALPAFIANSPDSISETDLHLVTFHLSRYIKVRGTENP